LRGTLLPRLQGLLAGQAQAYSWKGALAGVLMLGASMALYISEHAQRTAQLPHGEFVAANTPLAVAAPATTAPGAATPAVADGPAATAVPSAREPAPPAAASAAAPDAASATALATAPLATQPVVLIPSVPLLRLPVNAKHVLVVEEGSGRVMIAKDADAVVPIASLTKLMTAMVVLDAKLDPNEILQIAQQDVDVLKHSLSHVRVGSQMPRMAALKLALMSSDNRAAAALARTFPGGIDGFKVAMQNKIRSLGLTHTTIGEPTGLSPHNTSTATEVAKIAEAASAYPAITQITSVKQSRVAVNGRARELHNTNRLVGGLGWDIRLSKTGYTEEAGRCLTMRMKSGVKTYTVVLLDASGSAQRLRDAAKIRQTLMSSKRVADAR